MTRASLLLAVVLLLASCFAAQGAQPPAPAGASDSRLLSVDAMDMEIGILLRTLAVESGQNIVLGSGVAGKVTARLKELPLPDILTHLTRSAGLAWSLTDGAYLISKALEGSVSQTEAPPPAKVSEVWRCKYSRQEDLAAMLTKLFPALIVTAGPAHSDPELDGSAAAVTGSGVAGSSGASASGPTGLQPGFVVMVGDTDTIRQATDVLRRVDIRRQQVVVETLVSELSDDISRQLGVTWSWSSISIIETPQDKGIAFGRFDRDGMGFEGVLEAIDKTGKAKLLAKPSLVVVDGGHGSILIGDRINYPKVIGYTQLNTPMYDVQEEKVGIYLQIAPVISDDGYITMTVYPQVSVVKGFLVVQGSQYPQISTREAKTTVRLKPGERLAIGGLMRDDEIETLTKVPLLGDLPFIRNLFRHRTRSTNRTEIVIFLTPKIAPDDTTASIAGGQGGG